MVKRFDVYLVNLDPTVGHEIKKHRPCLVISPDELNSNISTVIVAPMTTKRWPPSFGQGGGRCCLSGKSVIPPLRRSGLSH